MRANGLALLRLGLSGEGSVVHNHVVRALDDANVSRNLEGRGGGAADKQTETSEMCVSNPTTTTTHSGKGQRWKSPKSLEVSLPHTYMFQMAR